MNTIQSVWFLLFLPFQFHSHSEGPSTSRSSDARHCPYSFGWESRRTACLDWAVVMLSSSGTKRRNISSYLHTAAVLCPRCTESRPCCCSDSYQPGEPQDGPNVILDSVFQETRGHVLEDSVPILTFQQTQPLPVYPVKARLSLWWIQVSQVAHLQSFRQYSQFKTHQHTLVVN